MWRRARVVFCGRARTTGQSFISAYCAVCTSRGGCAWNCHLYSERSGRDFQTHLRPTASLGFSGRQLAEWTINSDASGNDQCRSLVIATFLISDSGATEISARVEYEVGSVLRLTVSTLPPPPLDVSISDPAPLRGFRLFRMQMRWKLTQIFNWVARRDTSSADKPPKVS
jgi:hypothetical protein